MNQFDFVYVEPAYIAALRHLQFFVEFSRLVSLSDVETYDLLSNWVEESHNHLVGLGAETKDVCNYVTLLISRHYSPEATKNFIRQDLFFLRRKMIRSLRTAAKEGRIDGERGKDFFMAWTHRPDLSSREQSQMIGRPRSGPSFIFLISL